MKLAIVVSKFNPKVTTGLLRGAKKYLESKNITDVEVIDAPGAFEIPLIAKKLAMKSTIDGVICLGAVVKGDTAHFEYISEAATKGILNTMLEVNKPITFGILTTYTSKQAELRSQDDAHNKGIEAAEACYETALIMKEL